MRFAFCCLLSLLLLASALWPGEEGRRAAGGPALGTPTLTLASTCEPWESLAGPPDELERRLSFEPPPLSLDDGSEICWGPALAVTVSVPEFPRPQRAPAVRYVGPWLRVPQRPPSRLA